MANLLALGAENDPLLTCTADVLNNAFQVLRQLDQLYVLRGLSFFQIMDLVIPA